jgi:DNA polymerase/3'-5' exonuclease PolX
MSSERKMKLELAQAIAERFMKHLQPFVATMSIAGSTRRECAEVGDIEVVCVARDEFAMGQCFPEGFYGMVVNGTRLKRFKYGQDGLVPIQIELYITSQADYGRILAIRTGSSAFSHHLAMQWNRRGWCGTEDGLRRKSECDHKSTWKIKPQYKSCPTLPPIFSTEEQFFAFIGVDYIHPTARSWVSNKPEYNYSK